MAFDYDNTADLTPLRGMVLPYVLPILIRRAKEGRPITYSELAEEIEREYSVVPGTRRMTWWGWPVGTVGSMVRDWGLEQGLMIPPINVIVISKATKEPGTGADHVAAYFRVNGIDMKTNRSFPRRVSPRISGNFPHRRFPCASRSSARARLQRS